MQTMFGMMFVTDEPKIKGLDTMPLFYCQKQNFQISLAVCYYCREKVSLLFFVLLFFSY